MKYFINVCFLFAFLGLGANTMASDSDSPTAREPGQGLTIYLDVNPGGRTVRAAREMNELHAEYHEQGYSVIDVDPYIEDGDLKGFFITYVVRSDSE